MKKQTQKDKCSLCEKVRCKCKEEFNKDLIRLVEIWFGGK
jgi:hypothetical protein